VNKETLLAMPGKTEKGGEVIAASLSDSAITTVASKSPRAYHWWDIIHRKEP
jgi:hypothetical protein